MPRCASGRFMNVSQTKPVRAFSAISMVIPTSIPITSVSYQSVRGLKASTNPYRDQPRFPYLFLIVWSTCRHSCGKNGSEPPEAHGTTDPSFGPVAGGPPHTTYPLGESEAVIPQRFSL